MTTTASLTAQLDALSLADLSDDLLDPLGSSPSQSYSGTYSTLQRNRGGSVSSHSSNLYSDAGSAPNRPARSPLRGAKAELMLIPAELDYLQQEMSIILDKIYQVEELRHSPTLRSAHASHLDTLLSEVNQSVETIRSRVEAIPPNPHLSEAYPNFRKDWEKVTAQHALLKQEMLEDPWLIRFRTTADQAEAMMEPLNSSLVELTGYVGRILSSVSVPMVAHEGRLSIARLRDMAGAHSRLKTTYVPSINKILNMMAKSIADRPVNNGEALRRLNDMTTSWSSLQRHLVQLDAKVSLVLSQNDPDHPELDNELEMLDEEHMFVVSPRIPQIPKAEIPIMGTGFNTNVYHRGMNGAPAIHGLPPSSYSGLRPPNPRNGTGSVTPSAQRPLRRSASRATLSGSVSRSSSDRPRWNASTKPLPTVPPLPPSPPFTMSRRPSHAPSHASSHASHTTGTSAAHHPSSPTSTPPDASRIPQRTPMKSQGGSTLGTPTHHGSRPPTSYGTPTSSSQRPAGTRTPSGGRMGARTPAANRIGAATPSSSSRPAMGTRTPSGGRMSLASSTSAGSRPSISSSTRPSLAPALSRLPPSSWGSRSPAPLSVSRASSRMSVSSVTMATVELQPFVPSKYDQLDQEVQKVLDAVLPGIFVARVDQPLRRGQRKTEGETWTGEFLFGSGSRPTPVKLLELGSKMGPNGGKRVKTMVRFGGAWHDLTSFLIRKKEEVDEEMLDDEF